MEENENIPQFHQDWPECHILCDLHSTCIYFLRDILKPQMMEFDRPLYYCLKKVTSPRLKLHVMCSKMSLSDNESNPGKPHIYLFFIYFI